MGFLGKAMWSSRGVCVRGRGQEEHMLRNRVSPQICTELWKLLRPQKRKFMSVFLSLFSPSTGKGQMVIWCWLEFQNRPPSFHHPLPNISYKGKQRLGPCSSRSPDVRTLFRPGNRETSSFWDTWKKDSRESMAQCVSSLDLDNTGNTPFYCFLIMAGREEQDF